MKCYLFVACPNPSFKISNSIYPNTCQLLMNPNFQRDLTSKPFLGIDLRASDLSGIASAPRLFQISLPAALHWARSLSFHLWIWPRIYFHKSDAPMPMEAKMRHRHWSALGIALLRLMMVYAQNGIEKYLIAERVFVSCLMPERYL